MLAQKKNARKEHFGGARGCLWAASGKKGVTEQGLGLRCPGGLRGAPGVCAKSGPAGGPGGGDFFWAYWGPKNEHF